MSSQSTGTDRFAQLESLINKRFDNFANRFDNLEQSNAQITNTLSDRQFILTDLARENRQLKKHVQTLEDRLLKLEKQVNNTEQNNRKNNIEVDGIPSSVSDQDLRGVVAILFNHISESDITIADIEVAHRLQSKTSPKPTIVRLKRNLIAELKTKDARGKLKDIATRMNFPRGTKIFLNDNQSPNMRSLSYNARLLKSHHIISDTWFSNAAVRIKRTPTSRPIKITHEKDLVDEFPSFEHFTFDMEFYDRRRDEEDLVQYDDLRGYSDDEHGFERENSAKSKTPPTAADIASILESISNYNPSHGALANGDPHAVDGSTGATGGETSGTLDATGGGNCGSADGREEVNGVVVASGITGDGVVRDSNVNDGSPDANGSKITTEENIFKTPSDEKSPATPQMNTKALFGPSGQMINSAAPLGNAEMKSPINPHVTRSTTRSLALFK